MFLPNTESFLLVKKESVGKEKRDFLLPIARSFLLTPREAVELVMPTETQGPAIRAPSSVFSFDTGRKIFLPTVRSFQLARSDTANAIFTEEIHASAARSQPPPAASADKKFFLPTTQSFVFVRKETVVKEEQRLFLSHGHSFVLVKSKTTTSVLQAEIQTAVADVPSSPPLTAPVATMQPVLQEEPKKSVFNFLSTPSAGEDTQPIRDAHKRTFLKAASVAGVSLAASLLLPKKAEAFIMGSSPTTGVVGVKNAANTRINPATEETLDEVLKTSDLTFDAGSLEVKVTSLPGGGSAFSDSGDVAKSGLVDADRHVQVDVLSSALPTSASTEATLQTISFGGFKFALRLATVGDIDYVGEAAIGTATSAASWRVKKINSTTGIVIQWAGTGTFNQVWDNYASLTYS